VLVLLVASAMPALVQMMGPTSVEQPACKGDRANFCADVKPGGGRIVECLAGRQAELADGCRKVLESRGK